MKHVFLSVSRLTTDENGVALTTDIQLRVSAELDGDAYQIHGVPTQTGAEV